MKTYNLLALAGCLWMTAACSDFLELDESQHHTVEYEFSTFDNTKAVATNVYSYLRNGYSDVNSTMIDAATDDAVNAWNTNGIKGFYDGSWKDSSPMDNVWGHYYKGIAAANYFMEHCPADFPEAKYQEKYEEKLKELKLYPYEIQALRAYFHFELLKRYKNIVIADRQFTLEEVNELQPSSYEETVEWIAGECDEVSKFLPVTFEGMTSSSEIGRVTKGMVLALKARVLLYAASPLNTTDNREKWLKAAKAAKAVIDLNVYQEKKNEEVINNAKSSDFIFGRWNGVDNSFERANFPMGYEGGNSGVCPSQNLVEAFDMRDGTPFDWNNPDHRTKALDPLERDPRLAQTVLMNGQLFKGRRVESFTGGMNGLPKEGASPTSYYLRKHLKEDTDLTTGSATSYQHIWPLFRYAEVLLNYAEALLEATKEPDFKGIIDNVNYTLSPREAVNMVRARVDMNPIGTAGYDAFKKRVRNERRMELAFEGHRFWDIRRWKIGSSTTKLEGLAITAIENENAVEGEDMYTYSYVKKTVQERIWEDRMNYYPIQDTELFKNHNLIQNDGWDGN